MLFSVIQNEFQGKALARAISVFYMSQVVAELMFHDSSSSIAGDSRVFGLQ